jgi:hypothetical protein
MLAPRPARIALSALAPRPAGRFCSSGPTARGLSGGRPEAFIAPSMCSGSAGNCQPATTNCHLFLNSLKMRIYKNCADNLHKMNSSELQGLKPLRMNTYRKLGGGRGTLVAQRGARLPTGCAFAAQQSPPMILSGGRPEAFLRQRSVSACAANSRRINTYRKWGEGSCGKSHLFAAKLVFVIREKRTRLETSFRRGQLRAHP